ncbi:MAG: UDP-N-acetylglucosamine--N-acetylmuramyl-(pentapeptide) pyrophosphoryl-undecaprenol N-acetylglucosamine transferase [Caldilinea sp.]|nr:UDP-N-acetylglucosamine--N-acetylmuramyl-(pentapeptide) pyrophosphoryl-undecaprenol N-acetylglucosamine transferase [Caldilinea sp.]
MAVVRQLTASGPSPNASPGTPPNTNSAGVQPANRRRSKSDSRAARPAEPVRLLWIGSHAGMEKALVERAGIPFAGVNTGQLRGGNPLKLLRNLGRLLSGLRQSLAWVDRFQPDVCFVTGGYVCGPVTLACWLRRRPILIYLPDMTPGYAIRLLSNLATRVAISYPEVARWFGGEAPAGKAVVTGYPVRQEVVAAAQDRGEARRRLAAALDTTFAEPDGSTLPLLLVWGGSSGARAINQATWAVLPDLLPLTQVVHVVGERDWGLYEGWAAEQPLPATLRQRYHPVAYLHEEMALALAAANLTVARAGASILGEFPVAGVPAILAPLHSVNQLDNALALVRRGGAIIVEDDQLLQQLAPTVAGLLANPARLHAMEDALRTMAAPDAARQIAAELAELARKAVRGTKNDF